MSEDIELTANQKKSKAVQSRWDKKAQENTDNNSDRKSKRFNFKCFEGMKLTEMQKEFVVKFVNPPYNADQKRATEVYPQVFTANTTNSLKSNCSSTMNKSKIKEAILAYQRYALQNLKIEATSQNIDALRLRANYVVSDFYNSDGTPKSLDDISPEKLIVIDDVDIAYSNKTEKKIVKYKLADRDKAMKSLQTLLGIVKEMENINISVPSGEGKNAIDSIGDNVGNEPRITMNISVGNSKKEIDG